MSTNTPPHSDEPAKDASPEEIQADIEATRAELGDTVEQLSGRLDVKAQAKQKAGQYKAHAADAVETTKQQVLGVVTATGAKARELTGGGEENPAADRTRGGITLGSAGLLVSAVIIGLLVWRHHAQARKRPQSLARDVAQQLRSAQQKTPARKTGPRTRSKA